MMRKSWFHLLVIGITVLEFSAFTHAKNESDTLEVEIDPDGVAVVRAILTLPVPPERVRRVLMDFSLWPKLFPHSPILNHITEMEDRTRVDMAVPVFLVPWDLHLVTDTHEPQAFRIETQLVEGDFERYDWAWDLSPALGGVHTKCSLTLQVKPKFWTPGWLLRRMLHSEMEGHFQRLLAEVQSQSPQPVRSVGPGSLP